MKNFKQKFPFRAGIQFMLKNKCDYDIDNLRKTIYVKSILLIFLNCHILF